MKNYMIHLQFILALFISTSANGQTTPNKLTGNNVRKTSTSTNKNASTEAARLKREKAKKDSADAVIALAKAIAQEYIIKADSARKAQLEEETRIRREKYDELNKPAEVLLSKKERKEQEKANKIAEAKAKKEAKDEPKKKGSKETKKNSAVTSKNASKGEESKSPKTYAIIPFDVHIEKNLQIKKSTPEMLQELEDKEAVMYQNGAYQFLMKRKKEYAVDFQDIDDTNTILSRILGNGQKLTTKTKAEICELLQVDGIISGKFYRKEAMDQNVGKAVNLATRNSSTIGVIKTGDADLSLSLYDSAQKKVIWTYKNDDWNGMKDQADITDRLMQKAAKKFPFKK